MLSPEDIKTLRIGKNIPCRANFTYSTWEGEIAERDVFCIELYKGSTQYHTEQQLLLKGFCLTKNSFRTFAVKDITDFKVIK